MEQTHETFIQAVVGLARARLDESEQKLIDDAKITYGSGHRMGARGVTYFGKWSNGEGPETPHSFMEICAFGESDPCQIAGTTLHELAHVLSGFAAGHGAAWKETCSKVGLRRALAGGQTYHMGYFDAAMRFAIARLAPPSDGTPLNTRLSGRNGEPVRPRPCGASVGVRGGRSRGAGSGSRLRKVECEACGYTLRTTKKWLDSAGPPYCPCNNERMTAE